MKNSFILIILTVILCSLVFCLAGCGFYSKPYYEQLGETEAEGRIRHKRNFRVSQNELMSDIDRALLIDKPPRTTTLRIPK